VAIGRKRFMRMKSCINGFNPEEIFQLYAFVEAYETAGIKSYNKQTCLFQEHPELKGLLLVSKNVKCHKSCSEAMKSLDFKAMDEEIYFIKNKQSNLLSLLKHLRNSIAHACAVKHENKVLITDFKVTRPVDFSARGRVSFDIINQFTQVLNKVVL
jgi:hypothetical protein